MSAPDPQAPRKEKPEAEARKGGLTYAAAGVDISRADKAKHAILKSLTFKRQGRGAPLALPLGFAGAIDMGDHALVLCTDGVGTKVEVAAAMNRWETIGIDCVAMNVNDCVCVGAEPLAMVDYIVLKAPDPDLVGRIAIGLNEGARQANCSIIGGETAILSDLVNGVDLSGTVLGTVAKEAIVRGDRLRAGDVILGLASSGVHSNGYTLVRRILNGAGVGYDDEGPGGKTWGELLLRPTTIYVSAILELLAQVRPKGLANITGGGVTNLPRIHRRFEYLLEEPFAIPPLFQALQEHGKVNAKEMHQTFNMGMGFAVVVAEEDMETSLAILRKHVEAKVVGRIVPGSGVWIPSQNLRF